MRRARCILSILLSLGLLVLHLRSFAQCGNDNALTGTAVTPNCPGTTNISCVQGGQYALVNVVAGNTYTFSTCTATFDTQITLYNNTGGGALGYNDDACGLQSTVTWIASFTGQLRVLIDQFPCVAGTTCAPVVITCTPPPAGDCVYTLTLFDSFNDGWGTSDVGVSINGGAYTYYTVPNGVPSVSVQIGVYIGDVIVLTYDASGAFQTDNSYILSLGGSGVFNSGTPPAAGITYAATVDCQPPPAAQEDCIGATTICSSVAFNNNTTNTGNVADISALNSGCLDIVEYQGTWYVFSPSAGGNLGLSITPMGPDDYDWAIWGPYPSGSTPASICPPAGPPIRCAASSGPATFNSTGSYATGMGHATFSPPQFASTALSYGIPATTNICPLVPPQYCGWVPGMQVNAGEIYLMYISNWTQSGAGFSLDWTLQNGASLDCIVLPMELLTFDAYAVDRNVLLRWSTATETNSDLFRIERSADGTGFTLLGTLPAAGTTTTTTHYAFTDDRPLEGVNYYRLREVDRDGDGSYSPVRAVLFRPDGDLRLVPNPGTNTLQMIGGPIVPRSVLVLLDATGREVMRHVLDLDRSILDISALPRGLYAYRVVLPNGDVARRDTWVKE
ncbi:MAG: T9SS type A sorting domain-containing protein [Flavobacteriales bacterium]|nr:T9SS type A sorting domain-containing protein [Flavobacteriales bacterium]MCB9166213.1 T9SS type A sorting domain-containing protein [Flavobacteriales bacterium]